jgi:hypothetical protein
VNGMGDYWIRMVEQMVPATTIWNTGVRLENSVLHRQKFVWRRQEGCRLIPVPCKPCSLSTQLYVYDCPVQMVTCPIYPWISDPDITSMGGVLNNVLDGFYIENSLNSEICDQNTLNTSWYVDVRFNGVQLGEYSFYNGVGPFDVPTNQQWLDGLTTYLDGLLLNGYSYNINDDNTVTVFNNNCLPNFDNFEINVGINFDIYCNI